MTMNNVHLLFNTVFIHVLSPNFKVGNLFFQILLTFSFSDMRSYCRPNFALPGLKVVSQDTVYFQRITYGVHYEVVSPFHFVNHYEKRDYHSFTSLFEDILNT